MTPFWLLIAAMSFSPETKDIPPAPVLIQSEAFPGLHEQDMSLTCGRLVSGTTLRGSHHFGGISDFQVEDETAYLLSDTAGIFVADVVRSEQGWITGFDHVEGRHLYNQAGDILSKRQGDSESLLLIDDKQALISLERDHRIATFDIHQGAWYEQEPIFTSKDPVLKDNNGIEGMARLADGRLIAMSEGKRKDGTAVVYTQKDEGWTERHYTPASSYEVTELATDPRTGDLFVLERAFSRAKGARARLARVSADEAAHAEQLNGVELARLNFFHGVDNMEGMVVERTETGELRVHLISDDNFNEAQRTVIMGLSIDETAECVP